MQVAVLRSAVKLQQEQQFLIAKKLQELTGSKNIKLKPVLDTSLIAGLFKSTLVGYAAGGAVQAVSMAYLAHISGGAFVEYFRRGQTWGDGGMQAALNRQFDLNSRAEFLQAFAKQALERVKTSYFKTAEPKVGS